MNLQQIIEDERWTQVCRCLHPVRTRPSSSRRQATVQRAISGRRNAAAWPPPVTPAKQPSGGFMAYSLELLMGSVVVTGESARPYSYGCRTGRRMRKPTEVDASNQ